jgi:hypothetical protein
MYGALRPTAGELGSALPFTPKKVQWTLVPLGSMYIRIRPYTWVGFVAKIGCAPSAKSLRPAVTASSMCTWRALDPEVVCAPSRTMLAPAASEACQGPNFWLLAIVETPA